MGTRHEMGMRDGTRARPPLLRDLQDLPGVGVGVRLARRRLRTRTDKSPPACPQVTWAPPLTSTATDSCLRHRAARWVPVAADIDTRIRGRRPASAQVCPCLDARLQRNAAPRIARRCARAGRERVSGLRGAQFRTPFGRRMRHCATLLVTRYCHFHSALRLPLRSND